MISYIMVFLRLEAFVFVCEIYVEQDTTVCAESLLTYQPSSSVNPPKIP